MAQFAVYRGGSSESVHLLKGIFNREERAQQYTTLDSIGCSNRGKGVSHRVVPAEDSFDFPRYASNEDLNEIVREYRHLFP